MKRRKVVGWVEEVPAGVLAPLYQVLTDKTAIAFR